MRVDVSLLTLNREYGTWTQTSTRKSRIKEEIQNVCMVAPTWVAVNSSQIVLRMVFQLRILSSEIYTSDSVYPDILLPFSAGLCLQENRLKNNPKRCFIHYIRISSFITDSKVDKETCNNDCSADPQVVVPMTSGNLDYNRIRPRWMPQWV